jgi:hypothetical protein
MAAPAPSSPQQSSASSEAKGKETTAPSNAVAPDSVTDANTVTLDYLSIKQSPRFALAKQFLSSGDFDAGLSLIEEEIQKVREAIEQDAARNSSSQGNEDTDLHPALAPLYYLYGTTLLYSVEESEVMMNGDGGKVSLARLRFLLIDTVMKFFCYFEFEKNWG